MKPLLSWKARRLTYFSVCVCVCACELAWVSVDVAILCLWACSLTNPARSAPPYFHLQPLWLHHIDLEDEIRLRPRGLRLRAIVRIRRNVPSVCSTKTVCDTVDKNKLFHAKYGCTECYCRRFPRHKHTLLCNGLAEHEACSSNEWMHKPCVCIFDGETYMFRSPSATTLRVYIIKEYNKMCVCVCVCVCVVNQSKIWTYKIF